MRPVPTRLYSIVASRCARSGWPECTYKLGRLSETEKIHLTAIGKGIWEFGKRFPNFRKWGKDIQISENLGKKYYLPRIWKTNTRQAFLFGDRGHGTRDNDVR